MQIISTVFVKKETTNKEGKNLFRVRHDFEEILCDGVIPDVHPGFPVQVIGLWDKSAEESGTKAVFCVHSARTDTTNREGFVSYFSRSRFHGIGTSRAGVLYDRLTTTASLQHIKQFDALDSSVIRSTVTSLGGTEATAISISNELHSIDAIHKLTDMLLAYDGHMSDAQKLYHFFGDDAQREFRKNPYSGLQAGLRFSICDKAAADNGITPYEPVRITAICQYISNTISESGSCCQKLNTAVDAFMRYQNRTGRHVLWV